MGRKRIALALAIVLVMAAVSAVALTAWLRSNDVDGRNTRCDVYEKLSRAQQVALVRDTGHWQENPEQGASYYSQGCRESHPDTRLSDFGG